MVTSIAVFFMTFLKCLCLFPFSLSPSTLFLPFNFLFFIILTIYSILFKEGENKNDGGENNRMNGANEKGESSMAIHELHICLCMAIIVSALTE